MGSLLERLQVETVPGLYSTKKFGHPVRVCGFLRKGPRRFRLGELASDIIGSTAGSCLVTVAIVDVGQKNLPIWFMGTTPAFQTLIHMGNKVCEMKKGVQLVYEALGKLFIAPTRSSPYGEEDKQKLTVSKLRNTEWPVFHLATYIAACSTEAGMNKRVRELAESIAVLIQSQTVKGNSDRLNNAFISGFHRLASENMIVSVNKNHAAWTKVQNMDATIGTFGTLDYMFMDQQINDGLMTMFDCWLEIEEFSKIVMAVGWKVKIEHD